jgi:putative tricarboxylic transport membrane protein
MKHSVVRVALATVVALGAGSIAASAAWESVRPVEFIVPAGTGGGADQMARTIQGIVTKHSLMKQPMVVINKSGGAGGEGFLDLKGSPGNPHKIIITLSNLFTTPLATGIPFIWRDLTPVAMLALDEFMLWVNAEKPYSSVKDYVDAVKQASAGSIKMGAPDRNRKTRSSPSNSLVGTIMVLGLIALFWSAIQEAYSRLRGRLRRPETPFRSTSDAVAPRRRTTAGS